ncbi:MAG: hypothetical protein LBT75_05770, partial [Bacilli bacterium]|nr:hypothetical protein [Bacilli bacterium]
MKNKKKFKKFILVFIVIVLINVNAFHISASSKGNVTIISQANIKATITNAENETLAFDGKGNTSGNMKILKKTFYGTGVLYYMYEVNGSDSFKYESTNEKGANLRLIGDNKNKISVSLKTDKATIMEITNKNNKLICNNCSYGIEVGFDSEYYYFSGINKNILNISNNNSNLLLKGSSGLLDIIVENNNKDNHQRIFSFGYDVSIKNINNKITAPNAIIIPSATTKDVSGLSLRPVNNGKNLFLTWNKVKGAKSYVVYQYNYKTKKYYQVAIRKGNGGNYYNISNVKNNTYYNYVIRASKSSNG